METPPRAWGRLMGQSQNQMFERNTPTGVGKTYDYQTKILTAEKHPHGRGEDQIPRPARWPPQETPPRAWGRLPRPERQGAPHGNTPTGVGKTYMTHPEWMPMKKHPHGRGEDRRYGEIPELPGETPPRAWGRRPDRIHRRPEPGNTPTGVGKTPIAPMMTLIV